MNIRKLSNSQIDKNAWDQCIRDSENGRVYALSWYLDSLTNGKWDGLVLDNYRGVMPLPYVKKAGIRLYIQPWFCQQLGPFWIHSYPKGLLSAMKKKIASPFYHLNLNSQTRFFPENHKLELRPNMVLPLDKSWKSLVLDFRSNHSRNIKKAGKAGLEIRPVSTEQYLGLKKSSGTRMSGKQWEKLGKLLVELDKKNLLIPAGAWLDGELVSAVCWIKDFRHLVYFQAAGNETGKKHAAAFLLVSDMMQQYAERDYVIDFEGSSNQGVRRFYRGFGATNEAYPVLISHGMRILEKIKRP
ncbi:MAG: GNAT family N-acetyltransferase [Bacteroidales bacterium]